ncbi:hypothetical protein LBMAG57_26440 [Verrucomicrobiota bacterium]|nr:hypothetical protein LBMAG57_26440 [Verrucomicrobiota bacterium]
MMKTKLSAMKTSLNWILGVFLAPFLTLAQEDSLSVVRAAYGAGTTQRDVTQLLQAQVRGNQLTIEVGNHTLGGDPIFGKPKTLYVRYRKSGSEFAVSAAEGETLRIPAANAKAIALVQETRPQPPANQQPPSVQTVQPGTPLGEITTLSGKKYLNATLTRIEPNGISISYDAGLVKIPFTDLGEELRAKFGFDQQKAAQFTAATQETSKQKAAAQQKASSDQQVQAEQLKRTKSFDVQVVEVVKGKGAIVGPLTSTEEIPFAIFVEGLNGVADGEKYEIAAFRDGTYSGGDWKTVQRWVCKSVSKELRILNQQQQRNQPTIRPRSSSLQRIGGG